MSQKGNHQEKQNEDVQLNVNMSESDKGITGTKKIRHE